jgi:hypothetical protein
VLSVLLRYTDSDYPFGIFDRGLLDLFNNSNVICIIKTNVLSHRTLVTISDFDHRVDAIWISCSQRLN